MHRLLCVPINDQRRGLFLASSLVPVSHASLWTGRARVSDATNTAVPQCFATTMHRTRLSEMRHTPSRRMRMLLRAARIHPETNNFERGGPGTLPH